MASQLHGSVSCDHVEFAAAFFQFFSNSLKGITIAKEETRAETYTDDTKIIIKRNERNLRTQNNPGLLKIIRTSSIPEKNQCHANRRKL